MVKWAVENSLGGEIFVPKLSSYRITDVAKAIGPSCEHNYVGIRPGENTAEYIDGVMTRLTVWGSGYLILVCLMPQFLIVSANVPFYLGGTSLLIAVVVVMDFMSQVQSHLMSHQYESLLKKANLKGYGSNPLGGR